MTEHKKTPELRFSNFLDMWHIHKLSDVATITGGGTPSTKVSEYWDGEIDWYTPNEIGERIYARGSKKKITNLGYKKSSTKLLPINTILFTSRAGIGNTAILAKEGCTNQGFQSIIPNSEKIDSYFIYTISNHIKKYALKHAAGSTFLEISGKELGKMKLFLPSLKEQQKIGVFFSKLDRQIELEEQKLEKLEEQKKGYMQKIFSQVLRFKDEIGNEYPEWKNTKLRNVIKLQNGYAFKSNLFTEKGIPIIRITDINKSLVSEGTVYYPRNINIDEKFIINKNDILIAMSGATTGKLGKYISDTSSYLNQRIGKFVMKNKTNNDFLFAYLNSIYFKKELIKLLVSGAQPNISSQDIENIELSLPDPEEQRKIGIFLSNFDEFIQKQSIKIEQLKQRKKGLLQKMFV
ncbi:restriction endonuclease subunit S [Staphylococcus sp. IVB6233]|uniref:restriction endonuclease subunit S n=1 Tax=Staphylococcus sp. IVB6233 TaxID=2989769 RepID=UPI0021CF89B6|nr:restriction endonuclease subunit S [Staphylococcus sp. IVB6233]UXR76278.1 restriction endonuclease subunit S [Staphylococcus sp. IVB6233]